MARFSTPQTPPGVSPDLATESPAPQGRPSELIRAAITAALAIYLIGLVLTVMSNSGSGSSALLRTIKGRLFSPWMGPMWLDLGFDYRLTYGQAEDADHIIEVRPTLTSRVGKTFPLEATHASDTRLQEIRLPCAMTGERKARWQRLAKAIAITAEDPDRDSLLPTSIGTGLFDDLGATDVSLRVLRRPLAERSQTAADSSSVELEEVYAARVRRVGGQAAVQLIKSEAAGAVAPLIQPSRDK